MIHWAGEAKSARANEAVTVRLFVRSYPRNALAICRIASRVIFDHGIERIIVVHQFAKPLGVFVRRAEALVLRRPNFQPIIRSHDCSGSSTMRAFTPSWRRMAVLLRARKRSGPRTAGCANP